jgi:hypothetical protein
LSIEILWEKKLKSTGIYQLFHLPGIDTNPDRHALDADPDPNPVPQHCVWVNLRRLYCTLGILGGPLSVCLEFSYSNPSAMAKTLL